MYCNVLYIVPGAMVLPRNIPNRYTRDMLVARLDKGYKAYGSSGASEHPIAMPSACVQNLYDFVYLPIDFSSKCNVGYAFINFRTPSAAHRPTQRKTFRTFEAVKMSSARRFHNEFHMTKTKCCTQEHISPCHSMNIANTSLQAMFAGLQQFESG